MYVSMTFQSQLDVSEAATQDAGNIIKRMEAKTLCNTSSAHTDADPLVRTKRQMEQGSSSSIPKMKQYTLKHRFDDDVNDINQHLPPKKRRLDYDYSARNKESSKLIPSGMKERRRRHTFISEDEFNRKSSNHQEPNEWHDLPQGCIYKLEGCHAAKCRVVGRMTDQYNNNISVYLPKFFLERLMARNETNIKVFLRRGEGKEEVDIVTVEKSTCTNCGKDFSSDNRLKRHMTHCCKVL